MLRGPIGQHEHIVRQAEQAANGFTRRGHNEPFIRDARRAWRRWRRRQRLGRPSASRSHAAMTDAATVQWLPSGDRFGNEVSGGPQRAAVPDAYAVSDLERMSR